MFRHEIEPLVCRFMETAEKWRREELACEQKGLSPENRKEVEEITRRLIRRVLFFQVNRIKHLRNRGDLSPEAIDVIKKLFEVGGDDDASHRLQG